VGLLKVLKGRDGFANNVVFADEVRTMARELMAWRSQSTYRATVAEQTE